MAAAKGHIIPNAPKGRRKGAVNKTTALVKDMVAKALDKVGGAEYLERQAEDNPVAFMTLVGKLIPVQVGGDPDGDAISIKITREIVDP